MTIQLDLWGKPFPKRKSYDLYNGTPPHERKSETSREAAQSIEPVALSLREQVFAEIKRCGDYGATCDQIEHSMDGRHQTISARVRELALSGRIFSNGDKRKTRSGRNALVWRVR